MSAFKAVIFDWAGTMIDFGSFAPMGVFIEAFAELGITVSIDEAREPMGMPKWDHINAMLSQPAIAAQWQETFGHAPDRGAVDRVYKIFVPMNEKVVAQYADLVPGAKATVDWLQAQGIKIGSTTGYTRSIIANVLPQAARQGYIPQSVLCADDLSEGRPGPLMMYQSFVNLGVYPPSSVIKVDDTAPGIAEGLAAGCLTVGVAMSGNYVGKTPDELAALDEASVQSLRAVASAKLIQAGAHHVIDTVADLPTLMQQLPR